MCVLFFFFQAEDGIRDLVRSRGLGDVYKRQGYLFVEEDTLFLIIVGLSLIIGLKKIIKYVFFGLSLIHI